MALAYYNRLVNVKPRVIRGLYTPHELYVGMLLGFGTIATPIIFKQDPAILTGLLVFVAYSLVIFYFRLNKPEGYLPHLLKYAFIPIVFHPGKSRSIFPIKPRITELKPLSTDALVDYMLEIQKTLATMGYAPKGPHSSQLVVLTDAEIQQLLHDTEEGLLCHIGYKDEILQAIKDNK